MARAARGTRSATNNHRTAGEDETADKVPDLAITSPPAAAHFHKSKNAKATARKEAHAKAKEWHDRRHSKGKDEEDDDEGEDAKTPAQSDPGADVEGLEEAAAEPPRTTRRSTRARRATFAPRDDKENVADDASAASVSTRRSSRRRTMGSASGNIVVAPGSAEKEAEKKAATPTPRRSRRKTSSRKQTPSPVVEEEEEENQEERVEVTVAKAEEEEEEGKEEKQEEEEEAEDEEGEVEAKEEVKKDEETKAEEEVKDDAAVKMEEAEDGAAAAANEETAVVKRGTNPDALPEGEKEAALPQEGADTVEAQAEGGAITTEEVEGAATEAPDTLFMQYLPAYFHALLVMWTLAFAVMISPVGFDWYLSHLQVVNGGEDDSVAMTEAQRAPCAALALWLGTIAFWILAVGPQSGTGWALAGLSLAAASYSTGFMADDTTTPVPFMPLPCYAGYQIRVPDLLVAACYYGWLAINLCPRPVGIAPAPGFPQAPSLAGKAMPPDQERVNETQAEQFGGTEAEAAVLPEEDMGPRLFIGKRIAISGRGGEACLGTVDDYDSVEKEWSVRFDGGSAEEDKQKEMEKGTTLNRASLGSALKLHAKVLADDLKAMWLANEF